MVSQQLSYPTFIPAPLPSGPPRAASEPVPASQLNFVSEKPCADHIEHSAPPSPPHVELVLGADEAVPANLAEYYDAAADDFTDEDLVDWKLNTRRSLLILPSLPSNWPSVPHILEEKFQVLILSPNAPTSELVHGLANSSLYIEHGIDPAIRLKMARSTVASARRGSHRHRNLLLPQWRHMIENYMLNLACEAQSRLDYKHALIQFKRSLLSPQASLGVERKNITVTAAVRAKIWQQVQAQLYRRLGLDWEVDPIHFSSTA